MGCSARPPSYPSPLWEVEVRNSTQLKRLMRSFLHRFSSPLARASYLRFSILIMKQSEGQMKRKRADSPVKSLVTLSAFDSEVLASHHTGATYKIQGGLLCTDHTFRTALDYSGEVHGCWRSMHMHVHGPSTCNGWLSFSPHTRSPARLTSSCERSCRWEKRTATSLAFYFWQVGFNHVFKYNFQQAAALER